MEFQYISCCYLSLIIFSIYLIIGTFQYISCCYLSHVTSCSIDSYKSFNTSHVVIYHKLDCSFYNLRKVSIHLMLLFIDIGGRYNGSRSGGVQYISCCYLSKFGTLVRSRKRVSIHLMLLFIPENKGIENRRY